MDILKKIEKQFYKEANFLEILDEDDKKVFRKLIEEYINNLMDDADFIDIETFAEDICDILDEYKIRCFVKYFDCDMCDSAIRASIYATLTTLSYGILDKESIDELKESEDC